jgi:hypothetical protein
MTDSEAAQTTFKLRKIYKFLKENVHINGDMANSFLEKTQIFSIPIFYHILFMFTIIKTILMMIYFICYKNSYINTSISLIFIQLSTSFLLTQHQAIIKIKHRAKLTLNESFLEQVLKFTYILMFCLEENMTLYYYDSFLFDMNPGFIFFVILLILFFDLKTTKKFNEFLFYLYILNLVLLIYFLSLRNIMSFFLPINLVLSMFILLNVISQNFNKKLNKIQMYHKFFEYLLSSVFKLNEMYLTFEKKIIYTEGDKKDKDQNLNLNNQISNDELYALSNNGESTEPSDIISECSLLESKPESEELKTIPISEIKEFKGFELAYKNNNYNCNYLYFNKNHIVSFVNLLFYLKKCSSKSMGNCDRTYMNELESLYQNNKNVIRSVKLKSLIDKGMDTGPGSNSNFEIREKIISLMIAFIFEASCANVNTINTANTSLTPEQSFNTTNTNQITFNVSNASTCDDIISNVNVINNTEIELILNKSHIHNISNKKALQNFIEELSLCLNFGFNINNDWTRILINFRNNSHNLNNNLKFRIDDEEELITYDDLKSLTPRSSRKEL